MPIEYGTEDTELLVRNRVGTGRVVGGYRVLKSARRLDCKTIVPSNKETGFVQPENLHTKFKRAPLCHNRSSLTGRSAIS